MKKQKRNPRSRNPRQEDDRAGILRRDIGLDWKIVIPGLGLLGIAGAAGAIFLKRRKMLLELLEAGRS